MRKSNSTSHNNSRGAASSFSRPRQHGLTLIELLVAISVLAFVAVLGWRGLDSIVRARVALNSDLEQTRGMQLAFAQLQNDCAHIASASLMPHRAPLVADQGRLIMVRTVFADNQPSRLQVITYRVRDGALTRTESDATRDLKALDGLITAAANDAGTNQPVPLQSGVIAMTTRLWSADSIGWRDAIVASAQAAGAPAPASPQPQAGGLPQNPASVLPAWTGLELALQLEGREANMLKVFLLGAV